MPFDSTPITNPVIERLRLGRARVAEAWCQKYFSSDGHAVCAAGGITRTIAPARVTQLAIVDPEYDNALGFLAAALGVPVYRIAAWNDAPERTQADVLALYDKAIDLAIADALERIR